MHQNFGIDFNTPGFASSDLLNTDKCTDLLKLIENISGAPTTRIAASLFTKRYAFLTTAAVLFPLSVYKNH